MSRQDWKSFIKCLYSIAFRVSLRLDLWFHLGIPANTTFREKMRNFSFVFRRLFSVISQYFRKNEWSKKCKNEAKFRKFLIFRKYFSEFFSQKFLRNMQPWFLKILSFYAKKDWSKIFAKNAKSSRSNRQNTA